MKKNFTKVISLILAFALVFSIGCTGAFAEEEKSVPATELTEAFIPAITGEQVNEITREVIAQTGDTVKGIFAGMAPLTSWDSFLDNVMKVLYNTLNVITELLVKSICAIYPDPDSWKDISENTGEDILKGDTVYRTTPAQGSFWSLGYASESVIPKDFEPGKYYIGRDLNNKKAQGIYDDMRIRIVAIDDNSGDGISVFGALDCLGITSTDTRAVRKAVVEYGKQQGLKIQTVDICATHCHSALDTQGVSTQFFYKLFANGFNNFFKLFKELPGLEPATEFKEYFVEQSIVACKEAIKDMEPGRLFYDVVDSSSYVEDKRDLVSKENLPPIVCFKFVPKSGSENTYIANVTCHPTSNSASHEYVNSDYTYYVDKYIQDNANGNFLMCQGALGQVSRDIRVDETGMTEYESWGADARELGRLFGSDIAGAEYEKELAPIINVTHKEIINKPENSILALACEVKLVNNPVYYTEDGTPGISSEVGYLELGHEVGFAMFPGELYPETFWGTEITGDVSWDGTKWTYPSMHNSVKDVDVYCISLCDDATGYVVPDNYFAFMGHIIGEEIADETLSVGKHQASFLLSQYLDLVNNFTK